MKTLYQFDRDKREAGSALLIAIFALMLISVVGLALLVSTGTDSALAGNYRSATSAYYASVSGLEEARGRLLEKNPNYINKTSSYNAVFSGPGGLPSFGLTDVLYVVNPASGETVDPQDTTNPYADSEYATEMGWPLSGANVHMPYVTSISAMPGLSPSQLKWVRINAVTEKALGMDVDNSGSLDNVMTLSYDGTSLHVGGVGAPVLAVTALAVMPDNTKKLLQYVIAPQNIFTYPYNAIPGAPPNQDFPAALTLAGNNVTFTGPGTTDFKIDGQDQTPACSTANYMVASVGYTNSSGGDASKANLITGTSTQPGNYMGYPAVGGPPPAPSPSPNSLLDVSTALQANWLTPTGLEAIAQSISQNADVVIQGNATGNDIQAKAPTMSVANPMTIVVNGDLNLNSWYGTGYGLLLVTGTMTYSPTASWKGLVLVIGQGVFQSSASGTGEIDGAVFVAKTRDAANMVLSTLGATSFDVESSGSAPGIYYNSCWIHGSGVVPGAQGPLNYKILAFREITQ